MHSRSNLLRGGQGLLRNPKLFWVSCQSNRLTRGKNSRNAGLSLRHYRGINFPSRREV